jgi:hypothetical protein
VNTYSLRVQPDSPIWRPPALTEDLLLRSFASVVIRDLTPTEDGGYDLDLVLDRPSHVEAVNEILLVLQQLGYSVLGGMVREWASSTIEWAVGTALGGGGAAGSAFKDPGFALVAGFVGLCAGAVAGSFIQKVKVEYELVPTNVGWRLEQVPRPAPAVLALQQPA